jgi:prepilin-type processing-associated H-X9-DG protein
MHHDTWANCPLFTWADLIYPYLYTTRYFACPDLPQRVLARDSGRLNCPPIADLYGAPLGQEPGTSVNPLSFGYLFNESYNDAYQFCRRCDCYSGLSGLNCYHGMTQRSHFDWFGATIDVGVSLSAIEDPANTIVLADANPNCDRSLLASDIASFYRYPRDTDVEHDIYGNRYVGGGCYVGGRKMGRVDKRHREGANFLFADGHVRWLYQTTTNMWTRYAD